LQVMVARRHPQARQFLTEALRDYDLQVRLAAIAGLGISERGESLEGRLAAALGARLADLRDRGEEED